MKIKKAELFINKAYKLKINEQKKNNRNKINLKSNNDQNRNKIHKNLQKRC